MCIDNVILFPAIKTFAEAHEIPWVRIISCSENEISDPDIPPHLSGCPENDKACFAKYDEKFLDVISPIHQKFNDFLICNGEKPYPPGQFFETSPHLNLLLYPEAVKFQRRHQLDPLIFQYLEGCVREEAPYDIPEFGRSEHPLLYVSFGSLGAGDTSLIRRLISVISRLPVRALFNVGDYKKLHFLILKFSKNKKILLNKAKKKKISLKRFDYKKNCEKYCSIITNYR